MSWPIRIGRRRFIASSLAAVSMLGPVRSFASTPLIVNYYEDFVPCSFKDERGKMVGVIVDSLDHVLRERMGLNPEHRGYPWPRAQMLVERNEAHALCTIATKARETYLTFAEVPTLKIEPGLLVPNKHPEIDRLQKYKTVADTLSLHQTNYQDNGWAKAALKTADVLWRNKPEDVIRFLMARQTSVFLCPLFYIEALIRSGKIPADKFTVHSLVDEPKQSYRFGLRSDFPDCRAILAQFDREMSLATDDGIVQGLMQKYQSN